MEPVSASKIKFIHSLGNARERRANALFVAEGTKCVLDTLRHFRLKWLVATPQWYAEHTLQLSDVDRSICLTGRSTDMERISTLQTPPKVVAVYHIPEEELSMEDLKKGLVVALDRVQDPGNLGTIVRLCDWMGVHQILASKDTVDVYNPKCVQATMGSISRVHIHYVNLPGILEELSAHHLPVYGTYLDGEDIYTVPLCEEGVIVMGNEGQGISAPVTQAVTHRLYIPPFPADSVTVESLNVAVATALTLSEFRRRMRRE